ncbi:hypothetical protein Agabi119p4_11444 [Agaricus bisporus var. burnettii]|uniref:DUF159-domain-containing protein n=1 Tax=Agaricus bisporus var. burnettii TaxID=192524 RepID=A0A8H7BV20_AGABI|nr:hypothetical protein Agabi119p4_11444 [Agaricus bisporus var. burnettii]
MKWGLVPHWSTHENKSLSTTNARADTLVDNSSMWARLRATKRCVVPCQGYYEWLNRGKQKLPHFTKRKDSNIMLLAGLYDSAVIEGQTLWTFTIVTTDANKEFSWLHDRQPVILSSQQAVSQWLDQPWSKQLAALLEPYHDPDVPLECYQVPQEVGKVGTESPSFIEPVALRKDGIQAMFQKQRQSQKRARTPSPVPSPKESSSPKKKQKTKPITAFFPKK